MTDLHARFAGWATTGTTAELPRDLALHAFSCDECLALASGLDALHAIDLGAAPEPARQVAGRPTQPLALRVARTTAGLASLGLLVAAIVVGMGLIDPTPSGIAVGSQPATATASVVAGVLGGVPETPSAEPSPTPSATATDPESPSPTPSATAVPFAPAPAPIPTPVPAVGPPVGTPRPTAAPTTAAPSPTPAPTAVPTPMPTRVPTPSPSLAPSILPTLPPPSTAP